MFRACFGGMFQVCFVILRGIWACFGGVFRGYVSGYVSQIVLEAFVL